MSEHGPGTARTAGLAHRCVPRVCHSAGRMGDASDWLPRKEKVYVEGRETVPTPALILPRENCADLLSTDCYRCNKLLRLPGKSQAGLHSEHELTGHNVLSTEDEGQGRASTGTPENWP